MTDSPIAIVLGGTNPHATLIQKLKDRGYYVVLVDYLDNPPAKKVADEHVQASTLDQDVVLNIARQKKASLVISTCIDQANSVCCYVAEKLGLPHPYSYKTSLDVTDKGLMKKIMTDNGIPTSSYTLTDSVKNIDWSKVIYPAVVKPVDCNSSKGVHRVDSDEETKLRVKEALELSRTHMSIIEGFNQGEEIQVDCVSTNKGVRVVLTRQKKKITGKGNQMVLNSTGSIIPAPLSDEQNQQALEIAEKIAKSFGLINTPFFYQAIVTDKGIQVLEFAPRIGGGLSYYVIKELVGYDIVESAIDSFIGKDIDFNGKSLDRCYSTNLLYMLPGNYDHIDGLNELKNNGFVSEVFVFKNRGAEVDNDLKSSNRVAAFILSANSYDELKTKEKHAIESVEIRDEANNPLLNRSIYDY